MKKRGGVGPRERGGEGAGPGPESLTQWGKRTQGRGQLQSRDPPKAQRGWRFRKLPRRHPVAPFKGEDWKGGRGRTRDLFSVGGHLRGKVPGLGICVGDRCGAGATEAGTYAREGAKSPRRWPKRSAVGMVRRPRPLGGGFFEPG